MGIEKPSPPPDSPKPPPPPPPLVHHRRINQAGVAEVVALVRLLAMLDAIGSKLAERRVVHAAIARAVPGGAPHQGPASGVIRTLQGLPKWCLERLEAAADAVGPIGRNMCGYLQAHLALDRLNVCAAPELEQPQRGMGIVAIELPALDPAEFLALRRSVHGRIVEIVAGPWPGGWEAH